MIEPQPALRTEASPGVVLAMLLLVYTFNFLDRQVISILAQPIKAEMGFTDAQLGLLGGMAFAFFYSIMAVPLSVLADRTGRARVIAVSLVVWSTFTALCGLAGNFVQMFLARLGVGFGEAGGVAPSYAVIAERFPPHQQARALAIYSLGVPFGSAAGAFFGSAIAAAVDWRMAFIVLGVAGVIAAIPFHFVVRDRPRLAAAAPGNPLAVFRKLFKRPVFWLMALGAGMSSLCGYGLVFWTPALLQRNYGLDLLETGQFVGGLFLLGGSAGVMLGGVLGDWLGKRDRSRYTQVPAIAFLLCAPGFALAYSMQDTTAAFLLLLVPMAMSQLWLGPVIAAVQHLVEPEDRATASAFFLLVNNLIGMGLGSFTVGLLSDWLAPSYGAADALRMAMTWSTAAYVAAGLLMLLAAPRLAQAWRD